MTLTDSTHDPEHPPAGLDRPAGSDDDARWAPDADLDDPQAESEPGEPGEPVLPPRSAPRRRGMGSLAVGMVVVLAAAGFLATRERPGHGLVADSSAAGAPGRGGAVPLPGSGSGSSSALGTGSGTGRSSITQESGPTARAAAAAVVGGHDALGDGGLALDALIVDPSGVAADATGNVYVSDRGTGRVRKVDPSGRISTVLGGSGDAGRSVRLRRPEQLGVDQFGSVFVPDSSMGRVLRLDPSGAAELLAADPGSTPTAVAVGSDGLVAVLSPDRHGLTLVDAATGRITPLTVTPPLVEPVAVLPIGSGGWLVADRGAGALVQVDPNGGTVVLASVGGTAGAGVLPGDPVTVSALPGGLLAVGCDGVDGVIVLRPGDTAAPQRWAATDDAGGVRPSALFLGPDGRLLVADSRAKRIVRIDPAAPTTIEPVAGSGPWRPTIGIKGLDLPLRDPSSLAATSDGVVVTDPPADRVWRVGADGLAVLVAGDGTRSDPTDGTAAVDAPLHRPTYVAAAPDGTLYVGEVEHERVLRIGRDGRVTTVLAGSSAHTSSARTSSARTSSAHELAGFVTGPMTVAEDGTVVVAQRTGGRIVRIAVDGTVSTKPSSVATPSAIALSGTGELYLTDAASNTLVRVDQNAGRSTAVQVAHGIGDPLSSGNGSTAAALGTTPDQLTAIGGVTVGRDGIVVSDYWSDRLAGIDDTGRVGTFAGSTPTDVTASPLSQRIRRPTQLATGTDGSILVLLGDARSVRRLRADGTIETVVGSSDDGGAADGAPAAVVLSRPTGLAAQRNRLVVAETGRHRIRLVAPDLVSTLIGTGAQGSTVPKSTGSSARHSTGVQLDSPRGVATLGDVVVVADTANHRVLRIDATGAATVIAGTGRPGDDDAIGLATSVALLRPSAVAITAAHVFIADTGNDRVLRTEADGTIRLVTRVAQPEGLAVRPDGSLVITSAADHQVRSVSPDGTVRIVAGLGAQGLSGDGGPADQARLSEPTGIAVGPDGSLWVCDTGNDRIRHISPDGVIITVVDATSGLSGPVGIVVDPTFGMVISDASDRLLQVTPPELDRVTPGWSARPR